MAGAGVAGAPGPALPWLALACLGGFLSLQPLTILTKSLAGRRSRGDVAPALAWLAVYGLLALVGGVGLLAAGQGRVLWLGLAALPVLAWQMALVARRAERGQMGVELVGAGALALAAPAAYWVSTGGADSTGWWLWAMCWLLSAGAIVYIYLRLEHRRLAAVPPWPDRLRLARRSTLYNLANLLVAVGLAAWGVAPWGVLLPFGLMLVEAVYGGLLRPAVGVSPVVLGLRQMTLTFANSVLLILAYRF